MSKASEGVRRFGVALLPSEARPIVEQIDGEIADLEANKGDDPSLPFGVHWSECRYPGQSPSRILTDLRAKRALAIQVCDRDWQPSYAVRDVVLAAIAEGLGIDYH